MKIQVQSATKLQLDWLVAQCLGDKLFRARLGRPDDWDGAAYRAGDTSDERWVTRVQVANVGWFADYTFNPTVNWSQCGPIIETAKIQITPDDFAASWTACITHAGFTCKYSGPTPLIAAMRGYVASKLGNEVEIPDELCE